ncbi:MAG: DUF1326 domain-containing protein [Fimbriimonas sp.]
MRRGDGPTISSHSPTLVSVDTVLSAIVLLLVPVQKKPEPVKGIAFHLCSCSAPCPCMTSKTEQDMEGCQLTGVYRFENGGYVGKDLKGLTLVVVGRPQALIARDKRNGIKRPVDLVAYTPAGITDRQRKDLQFALIEHNMRFGFGTFDWRVAPIHFRKTPQGYSVRIPGVLDANTNALRGRRGRLRIVDDVPFEEGKRWVLGKTTSHRYVDPKEREWRWSYPANNGAWCFFSWDRIDRP